MGDPDSWRHEYLHGGHPPPLEINTTDPSVARIYDYILVRHEAHMTERR